MLAGGGRGRGRLEKKRRRPRMIRSLYIRKGVYGMIGFRDTSEDEVVEVKEEQTAPAIEEQPRRCVAKVYFERAGRSFDYYNDEFFLEPGDKVFVTGKFYGELGTVESVVTHFRIDLRKYKKVIGKPETGMTGAFLIVGDKMVSFDTNFDADRFAAVMIAPPDPEDGEEEIVCGEGWSVGLADFEASDFVTAEKMILAIDLLKQGRVLYLSVKDGKGAAFVRGTELYRLDFSFDGETVSDLYCSCRFNDDCLCKHEIAALMTLRELIGCAELEGRKDFVAFDADLFRNFAAGAVREVILR